MQINSADDDAAGLGISERLKAEIRSLSAATKSANDGVSMLQTAQGALEQIGASVHRLKGLAAQIGNGITDQTKQVATFAEFQAFVDEIARIAAEAQFNGAPLLNNPDLLGVDVEFRELERIVVEAPPVPKLTAAIQDWVSTAESRVDSATERLNKTIESMLDTYDQLSKTSFRITDTNMASEISITTRNMILLQPATAALTHAQQDPQMALQLLE